LAKSTNYFTKLRPVLTSDDNPVYRAVLTDPTIFVFPAYDYLVVMSVTVFEELFNSAILEVVVPDTTVQFPDQSAPDEWLETANSQKVDRKQAFFGKFVISIKIKITITLINTIADEQLQSLLLIRISNPDSSPYALVDRSNPPPALISFLSHLQISLEATYISPHPASLSSPPLGRNPFAKTTLAAPPRSDSVGRVKARLNPQNPSIFPPATPNPTPSTAETDRKYVQAEGTLLLASIWGQGQSSTEQSAEKFTLLWSEKDQVWVAVYRLALTVCTFPKFSFILLVLITS
jgi:hypothetical protein